jgi:hypothetical protein
MQNTTIRQVLDFIIVAILGAGAFAFTLYIVISNPHITVRYDCSIAEISPDYPIEVKEASRKLLRAHNF